jgi:uroporphyrinogen III methyltransferase/synthase
MSGSSTAKSAMVYLVGAGPGDPGLLTLRGAECLRAADVVIYDALTNVRLLTFAPPSAERVPVGKRHGERAMPQEAINELMIHHARAGRSVVRLKGGDPCVFGRIAEELVALRAASIPFEIVPGVTAGLAAPAYAGIPVTHRELASAVAFITGHEDPSKATSQLDWPALAAFPGTLVFYMGVRRLPQLAEALMQQGKAADTPAAVIQWGTTPRQCTIAGSLGEIAGLVREAGLCPPALIVIGGVAELAKTLSWFEARPLFGQRVVITRPTHQVSMFADRLTALGAEVLELPAIRIEPVADWSAVDRAVGELGRYDWVVFTSANGVDAFRRRVADLGQDARILGGMRVAAIGSATAAELERQFQVRADLVPDQANSESLVERICKTGLTGRLLLLRADQARHALPNGLRAAGIPFDDIAVYRTVDETAWDPAVLCQIEQAEVDWIVMTSPRIAHLLAAALPAQANSSIAHHIKVATISPITSEAVRQHGWPVTVEAAEASLEGLALAIAAWVSNDAYRASSDRSRVSEVE